MSTKTFEHPTQPQAKAQSDNLVVLPEQGATEQFARDLNHKIDAMESHFERLTDIFSDSQNIFTSSMKDLQGRTESLAEDIQHLSSKLEANYEKHTEELASEVGQTNDSLQELQGRIGEFGEGLQHLHHALEGATKNIDKRLEGAGLQIRNNQQQIEVLQDQHRTFSSRQHRLEQSSESQQSNLKTLTENTSLNAKQNQKQFDSIEQALSIMKSGLDGLAEDYLTVDEKAKTLSEQLDELGLLHDEQKSLNTKRFTRLAIAFGSSVCVLAIAIIALQYYPLTTPVALQTQIDGLSRSMETQVLEVSQFTETMGSSVVEMSAALDGLRVVAEKNENDFQQLQLAQSDTVLALDQTTETMDAIQRELDNLEFIVKGPGVGSEVAVNEGITLHDASWVGQLSPDSYSIQLLGVFRKSNLIRFVNKNSSVLQQQTVSYNVSERIGKSWYNLYYGNYKSFDDAQAALNTLPLRLRVGNPWIRRVSAMQKHAVAE